MLRFRPDDPVGGDDPNPQPDPTLDPTPAADPTPAPQVDYAKAEDVKAMQQQLAQIASFFQEDEDDPGELLPDDVRAYIQSEAQKLVAPYKPSMDAAVEEKGTRVMSEIFDEVEAEVGGKFDRKLAERVAHGFLVEVGDPREATKQGARFAFQLKQEYGTQAVKEYQDSLKRGHSADPDVSGSGEQGKPEFKTADEVIEWYASTTEV